MRERRCIVSRETASEDRLIRFVADPDGRVVADIAAKLPGRGAWVSADRKLIDQAIERGHFARALEGAKADKSLADQVEQLLRSRALSLIGLARKSGFLVAGMDSVRLSLKSQRPAWRIEAIDGAPDGRMKIDRLTVAAWGDVPVSGCFSAHDLGHATGRDHLVHALVNSGPQAEGFTTVMNKLSGFTEIDPVGLTGGSG